MVCRTMRSGVVNVKNNAKTYLGGFLLWLALMLFNIGYDLLFLGELYWTQYFKLTGYLMIAVLIGSVYFKDRSE